MNVRRLGIAARMTAAAVVTVMAGSCADDVAGPHVGLEGHFAVAPVFENASAGIVEIARIRFLLNRATDSSVARDTTVTIQPGDTTVSLEITVPILEPGETFALFLELISPSGDTVFRGGPVEVTPSTSPTDFPVITVPLTYVGTGANAAGVAIVTVPTTLFTGETSLITATALDNAAEPIPNTPIAWSALDTAMAQVTAVSASYQATVTAGTQRGSARIVAGLLTGQADTVRVPVQPVPTSIAADSGNGQTALVDSTLPQALVARVTAGDALGVQGVWVHFALAGGAGSLSADSALTDSTGRASTSWTLGPDAGPDSVFATTDRLSADTAVFGATARAGQPADIVGIDGDGQSASTGTAVAIAPSVRLTDVHGNPVSGVAVSFEVALGGGTLTGANPTTGVDGIAMVGSWTLGDAVGANTLWAFITVPGQPATDSTAALRVAAAVTDTVVFTATAEPGQPATLAFVTQPTSADADSVIAPPIEVEILDPFGNRVTNDNATTVDIAITTGSGTMGATLSGTTTRQAVAGLVTFDDLRIDVAGAGYTLDASIPSLALATSTPFDIAMTTGQILWLNASGGNWSVGTNWSTGAPPGITDTAVIVLTGTYTVTLDVSTQIAALVVGSNVTLSQAATTLTLDGDGAIGPTASYALSGGTLQGAGLLSIAGTMDWTGGAMRGSPAVTYVENSGTLAIGGAAVKTLTRDVQNTGSVVWTGAGSVTATDHTFTNEIGATFTVDADGPWDFVSSSGAEQVALLVNEGTMVRTVAGVAVVEANLTNSGTIDVLGGGEGPGGTISLTVASTMGGSINVGGGSSLQFSAGSHTLENGLGSSGAGVLVITGSSTVTIPNGTVTAARLDISGGTLTGAGMLSITGRLLWTGGAMSGSPGVTRIETSGFLSIAGSGTRTLTRDVENAGLTQWLDDGDVIATDHTFTNLAGATFVANGTGLWDFISSSGAEQVSTFLNQGDLQQVDPVTTIMEVNLINDGIVQVVTAGTFGFPVSSVMNGSATIAGGGTLAISAGSHTWNDGFTVTGAGAVDQTGGTVTVAPGATASVSGYILAGGTLQGAGTLSVTANMNWTGGSMTGSPGITRVESGGGFAATGAATRTLTRDIENAGTWLWTGTGAISSNSHMFTNLAGAAFNTDATGLWDFVSSSGAETHTAFNNFGVLVRTGTGTTSFEATVVNSGTVDAQAGTIAFPAGFSFSHEAGGVLQGGGTIALAGAIPLFEGDVRPGTSPGILTIDGPLPQTAVSTLFIEVGGTTPGTQHDLLHVTGLATLSGALSVEMIGGFVPAPFDTIPILAFGGRSGTFPVLTLPDLSPLRIDTVYTSDFSPDTLYLVFSDVPPGPPGTEAAWLGLQGSDWFTPGNWSTGLVPDDTTNVFIPAGRPSEPSILTPATVDTLVVDPGVTLTLNSTLTASGSVDASTTIAGTGTLVMAGAGMTLRGSVPALTIAGATTLSGTVTVTGDLLVTGTAADLVLGGFTIDVSGNVQLLANGELFMDDPADQLIVLGDFLDIGNPGSYTAGVIEVTGNFAQQGLSNAFQASGTHLLRMVGTAPQTISFEDNATSHPNDLEIANAGSTVTLLTSLDMPNLLTLSSGTLIQGAAEEIRFASRFPIQAGGGYQVVNTILVGAIVLDQDETIPNGDPLVVRGTAADLTLNGFTLTTTGDLSLTSGAELFMDNPADQLIVLGDFLDIGNPGSYTAGVIEVTGDFTQQGLSNAFQASGTHLLRMVGTAPQTISFEDNATSHPNDLEIANTGSTVTLLTSLDMPNLLTLTSGTLIQGAAEEIRFASRFPIQAGGSYQVVNTILVGAIVLDQDETIPNGDPLVVRGTAADLTLNGFTLTTTGDLSITSGAELFMDNPADQLIVLGDFLDIGNPGSYTAGVIEVTGNFTQQGLSNAFQASGTHLLRMVGTAPQTISFEDNATSHPNDLEIANTGSTVTLLTSLDMPNLLTLISGTLIQGVAEEIRFSSHFPAQVGGSYNVVNTVLVGAIVLDQDETIPNGNPLLVRGTAADLTLNGFALTTTGDLSITSGAELFMDNPADQLIVLGDFLDIGNPGSYTAGVIEVTGNFTQQGLSNAFQASGTHLLRMVGTAPQTISFEDNTTSRLANLDIANNTGVTLLTPVVAAGDLIITSDFSATLHGDGNALTVAGLNVDGVQLDSVAFVWSNGPFTLFDNVTFGSYDPLATQFSVTHPGGAAPFTMNGLTFVTVPAGGLYISATDNTADANVLTIDLVGASPLDGSSLTSLAGGAIVNWPVMTPPGTTHLWLGTVSSDWFDAANWDGGLVPTFGNNVFIPAAAPNQPDIGANAATADSVLLEAGATLNVDVEGSLLAFGSVDAGNTITGGGVVQLSGFGTRVKGSLPTLSIAGQVTVDSGLTVTGDLVIAGQLDMTGGSRVTVTGIFATTGGVGVFTMSGTDTLDLVDATFSGDTMEDIVFGPIFISGDFVEGGGATDAFQPDGPVIFDGTGPQSIIMTNGGAFASSFKAVEVTGVGPISSGGLNPVVITDQLIDVGTQWFVTETHFVGPFLDLVGTTAGGSYRITTGHAVTLVSGGGTLSGPLDVTGQLDLGGFQLGVTGDFTVGTGGSIVMGTAADELVVGGNATFQGASTAGDLSNGTLRIAGDFTQTNDGLVEDNFQPTGTNTVVLNGLAPQTVSFEGVAGQSVFQFLQVSNPTGVTFTSPVEVNADVLTLNGTATVNGTTLQVLGDATFAADITLTQLSVAGALSAAGGYAVTTTIFSGTGQTIPALSYDVLRVTGTASLGAAVATTGNVEVNALGALTIGANTLNVGGNLFTQLGPATLVMSDPASVVDVVGNVTFDGGSTDGLLTDGVLHVGGNFTQGATASDQSFAATAPHATRFEEEDVIVTIDFATADSITGSHFGNVVAFQGVGGIGLGGLQLSLSLPTLVMGNIDFNDNNGDAPLSVIGAGELIVLGDITTTTTGAGVDVTPLAAVRVGGTLNADAGTNFAPTETEFFGSQPSMVIPAGAPYQYTDVVLSGTGLKGAGVALTIPGNVTVRGSTVLNAFGAPSLLTVNGDLVTTESGTLQMNTAGGAITVDGNALFDGASTSGRLTTGTLLIAGNFVQAATTSNESYAAEAGHTTLLSSLGTQTVDYATPDTLATGSHFGTLIIQSATAGGQTTTLNTIVPATGPITLDDNNGDFGLMVDGPGELLATGDVTLIATGAGVDVTPAAVRLGGLLSINFQTFAPAVAEFFGPVGQFIPAASTYQDLLVTSDSAVFSDTTITVQNDLRFEGNGVGTVGFGAIIVNNNLQTTGQGALRMDNSDGGSVIVNGDALFSGGSTAGRLIAAGLILNGDFFQSEANSPSSYASSGSHSTSFAAANNTQVISFARPDSSYFNQLALEQSGTQPGISLSSDVSVHDFFSASGDAVQPERVLGNGHTLYVGGLNVDTLILDSVPLVWADSGAFSGGFVRFLTVDLNNYDSSVTQITVIHNGQATPYAFTDVQFNTEAVGGPTSYYLRARDNDGLADFLTIVLTARNGFQGLPACYDIGNLLGQAADLAQENGAAISDVVGWCQFS